MWEPFFLINTLALGLALLCNTAFLIYLVLRVNHTTGARAIVFSSLCTTLFILTAFLELFFPIPLISYSVAFVAPFLLTSYLLIAQLVPHEPFKKVHVALLALATVGAIIIATPGLVYKDLIPNPEGYVLILPGPYSLPFYIYLLGLIIATVITYVRRLKKSKGTIDHITLSLLMKSFLVYITGFVLALIILPAFGINFFTNLVLGFSMTIVIGTFTIIFTHQTERKKVDGGSLV